MNTMADIRRRLQAVDGADGGTLPAIGGAAIADKVDYIDRRAVLDTLSAEFEKHQPGYQASKDGIRRSLEELRDQVLSFQAEGSPLYRSQQLLSEAEWMFSYTCDWNSLRRQLATLAHSLTERERETEDQRRLVAGEGGGFDAGAKQFFQILDNTADAVQRADYRPQPLAFLKPYLSPGRLLAYLHGLQTSDIAGTGVNQRGELASVESSILQFLIKPRMRALLSDPKLWGTSDLDGIAFGVIRLSQTFSDFLDQSQHPRTGFWGPWYLIGGELLQLHDLSFTFHIVNFRKGRVDRWPMIIDTIFEIRALDLAYPYGWRPSDSDSPYSNHHNADVATLLKFGYPNADAGQKRQIGLAMFELLNWCLTSSLCAKDGDPYGDFKSVDEFSTVERYAFGILFLHEAGFWTVAEPFWWDPTQVREAWWPDATAAARGLSDAVRGLKADASSIDDIHDMLAPALAAGGAGAPISWGRKAPACRRRPRKADGARQPPKGFAERAH